MEALKSEYENLNKQKEDIEGKISDLNEILNSVSYL